MEFKLKEIVLNYGNFIVIGFLLVPFLYYLFAITYYIPAYDESFQIEAAIRLYKGFGNTYSFVVNNDLSTPNFTYQNAWPPGFSYSLKYLLFTGLPIEYALKLFKVSIILITIFTWLRLSNFYIKDIWLRVIFAGIATAYIIKFAQSVSDLIVVLFLSILSILLLIRNKNETTERISNWLKYSRDTFFIGVLIGIMLLFKYSSMFIAVSCAFWIFIVFKWQRKKSLLNLIKYSTPVIAIIVFSLLNSQQSKTSSAYAITGSKLIMNSPIFYDGWARDIFNAIFQSTYLDKMISAIISNTNDIFLNTIMVVKAIFFLTFFSSFFFLFKKGGRFKVLLFWVIINFIALVVFLKFVSGLFFADVMHWLPIKEGRYYWPLCLFMPMLLLIILEPQWILLSSIYKATVTLVITILIFVGLCFYADYKYNQYISLNSDIPLLNLELDKLIKEDTNAIIFSDQINWQLYLDKGRYNVFGQQPNFSSSHYFSKKTIVILLYSTFNYHNMGSDIENNTNKIFDKIAKSQSFNRVRVGKFTMMFWREFPAGFSFN